MDHLWNHFGHYARAAVGASLVIALSAVEVSAEQHESRPSADSLLEHLLDAEPWGLFGGEVHARTVVTEAGKVRELEFDAKSRRHEPSLSMGMIRFTKPEDIAGTKFLQIQRKTGDDERYLYSPTLKRARLVAADARNDPFMGTDFSYADMDRRDLRKSKTRLLDDARAASFDCYQLEIVPNDAKSMYGRLEVSVRKSDLVGIQWAMFDRAGKLLKTLQVRELRKIGERTFVTGSIMINHTRSTSTELLIEKVVLKDDIPLVTFALRELEKQ